MGGTSGAATHICAVNWLYSSSWPQSEQITIGMTFERRGGGPVEVMAGECRCGVVD